MKRKRRKNFEIRFYEKLLRVRPDFVHVLFCLGDAYTQKGFYKEGLEVDKRLAKLKPEDPIVHYNLACSFSLVEDIDAALREFKKAVLLGYDDFSYIFQDADLENLRKDAAFKEFLCKIRRLEERSRGLYK
ncbi:MAG: hypothetical protein JSV34_03730 [Candidatus Omnitrophota bacterium]|nr:MAG: hypothetical protein JSV34_03730 [Candidatus Omnitrophota bacterium]